MCVFEPSDPCPEAKCSTRLEATSGAMKLKVMKKRLSGIKRTSLCTFLKTSVNVTQTMQRLKGSPNPNFWFRSQSTHYQLSYGVLMINDKCRGPNRTGTVMPLTRQDFKSCAVSSFPTSGDNELAKGRKTEVRTSRRATLRQGGAELTTRS